MKPTLSTLTIVHYALTLGPLVCLGVFYFLRSSGSSAHTDPEVTQLLTYMAIGMTVMALAVSSVLPAAILKPAREETRSLGPEERFATLFPKYYSAKIIQWAVLEGAAIFCGVVYLMGGPELLLGAGVLLVLYLAMQRPGQSDYEARTGA